MHLRNKSNNKNLIIDPSLILTETRNNGTSHHQQTIQGIKFITINICSTMYF